MTGAFLYSLSAGSPCNLPDIGSNASAYSTFAGVLAGFSFTALVVYLQRQPKRPENIGALGIHGSDVAASLLYSTASLIISSFLYANLISQAIDFRRATGELLIYGGVLGLSVLVMLYSLTLMIYEVPDTREATKYAYWLTVIAGPTVIFRFLVDVAQLVWHSRGVVAAGCNPAPSVPPVPQSGAISLWGDAGIAGLLIISSLITVVGFLRWWDWTREKVVKPLAERPTIPALAVFITATVAAIASLAITGRASFTPAATWFTGPVLGAEGVLLAGFALACGCVIGARAPVILPGRLGRMADKGWRRWLQDRTADRISIVPHGDIQDLDAFRTWLAGAVDTLDSCRKQAQAAISCGGAIPFNTSMALWNKLRELGNGLRVGGSRDKHPRVEADAAEAQRYRQCMSRLQEDVTVMCDWYRWFYTTPSPSPDGMFGAIRTKLELSTRILDDLDAVLRFVDDLQDRLSPGADTSARPAGPRHAVGQVPDRTRSS